MNATGRRWTNFIIPAPDCHKNPVRAGNCPGLAWLLCSEDDLVSFHHCHQPLARIALNHFGSDLNPRSAWTRRSVLVSNNSKTSSPGFYQPHILFNFIPDRDHGFLLSQYWEEHLSHLKHFHKSETRAHAMLCRRGGTGGMNNLLRTSM